MVNKILIDTNVLIDYLLEREPFFEDAKERREVLSNLCSIFDVEGIDKDKLLAGPTNEDFSDFEDCLQMECAKSYGADYIVTRNVSDYSTSEIKAIMPKDYLEL